MEATVAVRLLTGLDKELGYRVPPPVTGQVAVGSLVRVPVRGRTELGIVTAESAGDGFPVAQMKYLYAVEHGAPVLTPELLELARWVHRYYAAGLDGVLEAMIPAAVRNGMRPKEQAFLSLARAPTGEEWAALEKKAPRQAELVRFLQSQPRPQPRGSTLSRLKIAASTAEALVEKGFVRAAVETVARNAYDDEFGAGEAVAGQSVFELTEEQRVAVEALKGQLEERKFAVSLLHGVTGSGKTEVYLHAIERVLEAGGGVLFLVPEVALAPQTVGRLRSRLDAAGIRTVVWHSHLSDGERLDAWSALTSGEARVVVGARSAVFAPVRNLRLLIVDEEHEPAYKQDEVPRYHGRDVAVMRAKLNDALCVLGSATPSLESLYNAAQKKYGLLRLTKRVDDRSLPDIHIVDMTREVAKGEGHRTLSRLLVDKLRDRVEKREQSILFLNRRGYHTSLLCPDCGHVEECPHCSVSMVFHRDDDRLRCHLCGHERGAPHACPSCKSAGIRWRGFGTQRIEDLVAQMVPQAKVVRIDTDALRKKNLFRKILSDFRTGKIDILVGTQMIAKGLDFPGVTLVGLVDADLSLHLADFRAAERTFQLLVQVSGRAGRGDLSGEVVVQSYLPYSAPIQYARSGDFDGFLEAELDTRREYHYPPYRHLICHSFRGPNPDKVSFYAEAFVKAVAQEPSLDAVEIRGPAPAPLEKVKDAYRFQVWYFTEQVTRTVPALVKVRESFPTQKDVTEVIDVDPVHLL